jgi:hypothetical protein
LFGVLCFAGRDGSSPDFAHFMESQKTMAWSMDGLNRTPFCAVVEPEMEAYAPASIINGYTRPYGGPQLWMSEVMSEEGEEWISLSWKQEVAASEIRIIFNDDVNEDLINLHHHRTPFEVLPELVRDYRLEGLTEQGWRTLHRETGNHKRLRVHKLEQPEAITALRLVVESTNGSPYAQVVEIRVYE